MNISTIGFKLTAIIILIVLVSLSVVTAFEFYLVRHDMLFSAQYENFETNRFFAEKAEETFSRIKSNALLLAQMPEKTIIDFFFDQNPRIAVLYFAQDELFINERFFLSRAVDSSLVRIFINDYQETLALADFGETIIENAAVDFGINLLAMFFPGRTGAQMVLFSPDDLTGSLGFGINKTYMLSKTGDLLIHEDYELIRLGFNASEYNFVREIIESPAIYRQSLIEADFGIFAQGKGNVFFHALKSFFGKAKDVSVIALSETGKFIKTLYNNCADFIFKLINKDRKAPRNVIIVETHKEREYSAYDKDAPSAVRQYVAFSKLSTGGSIVITSVEYNKLLKNNEAVSKRFLFLAGGVFCFSVILIWFFVKSVFMQQNVLVNVANQIELVSGNIRTRDLLVILLSIIGIIAFFSLFRLSLPSTAGLFEDKSYEHEGEIFLVHINNEDENEITEIDFYIEPEMPSPEIPQEQAQIAFAAMPESAILSAIYSVPLNEQILPAPENLIPHEGYRVDIEHLRAQKKLRFNWSEAPGANAYIFSLYQQTAAGRRLITRTTIEYRTGWVLENINVLSRGTFIWQVEAIVKGRSGAIDRRGKTADNAFIVE